LKFLGGRSLPTGVIGISVVSVIGIFVDDSVDVVGRFLDVVGQPVDVPVQSSLDMQSIGNGGQFSAEDFDLIEAEKRQNPDNPSRHHSGLEITGDCVAGGTADQEAAENQNRETADQRTGFRSLGSTSFSALFGHIGTVLKPFAHDCRGSRSLSPDGQTSVPSENPRSQSGGVKQNAARRLVRHLWRMGRLSRL